MHGQLARARQTPLITKQIFKYDHANRLIQIETFTQQSATPVFTSQMYDALGRRGLTNTEVVGKFNVSTGTVYQGNKPVLQFNMTEGEEFHIQSFTWMDERGDVIASQATTTSDAAKPDPQELAATWHLNQLDGTEFTNTKSWMATEFAFAGNKRGTVNSDPLTELQTSNRSLHEGRYALFLESEDAAYRSWADPAHEVLNYVGIIDPFGIADGINAVWYVGEGLMGREGAFLNAGISAAGALLPYVGDLLKFGKAGVKAAEACGVFQKLETKAILKQSAKSAAIGAASGAAIGGTVSHVAGGDAWHGATQGALHGAVGGFSRGFFLNRFAQACFTAGTPLVIDFEGNSKPIEQIQVGEMVLARSEFEPNGPLELKRVEELFTRTSPIIELEIGGQKIGTTDEHPFYVPAREAFVPARELQVGDQLISHDGRLLRIDAIHATLQIATVYNLRVVDYHTYFVGCDEWGWSVWAHNASYSVNRSHMAADEAVEEGILRVVSPRAARHHHGPHGKPSTVLQNEAIVDALIKKGWKVEFAAGVRGMKEEYIYGPGGSALGRSSPDISAWKLIRGKKRVLRINTYSTKSDGTALDSEAYQAVKIRAFGQKYGELYDDRGAPKLLLIPKVNQ
jgi:hypothetical protein